MHDLLCFAAVPRPRARYSNIIYILKVFKETINILLQILFSCLCPKGIAIQKQFSSIMHRSEAPFGIFITLYYCMS
jgi:hypothetical protein